MKKTLVLLAALAATATTSFAQAPASSGPAPAAQANGRSQSSPEQQAERRAQYLAKELNLSADQQARLQPILLAQRQEMMSFRDKTGAGTRGSRQGMGQQLKASQAKYEEQIRAVLTPEQFAKFDEMKDDRREQFREQRQGGRGRRANQ
jgi:Spy/CpxP family protein refolding chaperone